MDDEKAHIIPYRTFLYVLALLIALLHKFILVL
jgi:hypothetical protein